MCGLCVRIIDSLKSDATYLTMVVVTLLNFFTYPGFLMTRVLVEVIFPGFSVPGSSPGVESILTGLPDSFLKEKRVIMNPDLPGFLYAPSTKYRPS